MKKFYVAGCMILVALWPCFPAAAQEGESSAFLQNLSDIPLMPGLHELPDEGVVFDKPGGRIAEAEAAANMVQATDIQTFYMHILPHLGWNPGGQGRFIRDGEVLRIAILERDSGRTVHFAVTPQP